MRQSYDIRATVANMSYSPIRCDRNVIMVAMSYFCRQNVSQISLEIVVNCSHPSEILALKSEQPAIILRHKFEGLDGV